MDRRNVLKGIGALGIASIIPKMANSLSDGRDEPSNDDLLKSDCTTIPSETAGPYPVPSSVSSSTLLRSEITEGTQTGIPLTLTFTFINVDNNCEPVEGLRVDIWHCNTRGYYSAYDDQPGIDGSQSFGGETWLRGIQYTDSNGQVTFTSIYPGWYTPRATHIHIQVFDSSNNEIITTQVAFPDSINTTVNAFYATSGTNSFTNINDMVFSDSYTDQLMTVTGNTTTGYLGTKEIAINAGAVGLEELNEDTNLVFSSFIVYPIPSKEYINVGFKLSQSSNTKIKIYDMKGNCLKEYVYGVLLAGQNSISLEISELEAGNYFLQLNVDNVNGTFKPKKEFLKIN